MPRNAGLGKANLQLSPDTLGKEIKLALLTRMQSGVLVAKEVFLGLAALVAPLGVDIDRIVGQLDVLRVVPALQNGGVQFLGVDHLAVIHEVLEMVGVAALACGAEDDHGFADEDAAARLLRAFVQLLEGFVQRLDFLGNDASAVFGADREQTLLAVVILNKRFTLRQGLGKRKGYLLYHETLVASLRFEKPKTNHMAISCG